MKKQNFFLAHKQFTLFFILALVIVGVAVFAPYDEIDVMPRYVQYS